MHEAIKAVAYFSVK